MQRALLVSCLVAAAGLVAGGAPAHPSLAGTWTLDRAHSQLPADITFGLQELGLGANTGDSGAGGGGGRGGRGGGGRGVSGLSVAPVRESEDDAKRREQLIAELRQPPATLTISQTGTAVTIAAPDGAPRTFRPGSREDIQQLKDVPVSTTARWTADALEITYAVEQSRTLRYVYSRAGDTLVVEATPLDHGKGETVKRVYTRAPGPRPAGRDAGAGLP